MGKQTEKKKTSSTLRNKAEARLRKQAGKTLREMSTDDSHSFIHELQVHQIELEMQNEELRASQESLEDSRSRYSDLYDFAPISYFTLDKNGLILEANMTGAEQLGLKRNYLIKKPFSRFIHKDDADIYYLYRRDVMQSKKRMTCDIRMMRSDNTEFYAQLVSAAIKDARGSTLVRSAVINITDRRKAEIALLESETTYRNLVDNSLVGIFKTHISGKFLYVNDAFAKIYEYDSPASVLSANTLSFYKNPEERADVIKILRSRGIISNHEIEAITNKGHTKNVLFNAALEGDIISGMVMDITERKKAELEQQRLTKRLEAQWKLAGMVDADPKQLCNLVLNEIVSMTESRYGFYGFVDENADVMSIHAWSEEVMKDCLVHDSSLIFPIEKSGVWGNAIRNRKTLVINDYPGENHSNKKGLPDGHVSINRIMMIPVFRQERIVALGAVANKSGNYSEQDLEQMNAFLQSAQLIQDKRLTDEELKKHREQLMELVDERTSALRKINEELESEIAERTRVEAESIHTSHLVALGELAAGVAHEINNPINGIINYAQILANKSPQGSKEHDVSCRVIKEGDRIANIVSSLLSFARAVNTAKERVRITDIMSESIALTQAQFRNDGIHLNLDIPESIPAIFGQMQQIEQVFLNIISNARYALNQKYPGADENKILNITAKEVSVHNQPYVQMSFYDAGHGIPASLLDKIMNPFFTSKPRGVGTGLGLSISHGIINDHDGRIMVDSVEGEYTEIIIELPAFR